MRNQLGENGADQFVEAMKKGFVSPQGKSGIKMLSGNGVKIGGMWYQYEVKVLNQAYSNYRLYGNYSNEFGRIIFTLFDKAKH